MRRILHYSLPALALIIPGFLISIISFLQPEPVSTNEWRIGVALLAVGFLINAWEPMKVDKNEKSGEPTQT